MKPIFGIDSSQRSLKKKNDLFLCLFCMFLLTSVLISVFFSDIIFVVVPTIGNFPWIFCLHTFENRNFYIQFNLENSHLIWFIHPLISRNWKFSSAIKQQVGYFYADDDIDLECKHKIISLKKETKRNDDRPLQIQIQLVFDLILKAL